MKYYTILILIVLQGSASASSQAIATSNPNSTTQTQAANIPTAQPEKPLPSLGSCDEYTDYYIYQCMPHKCSLQIGDYVGVTRTMETIGYKDNLCVHNIVFRMRNPKYPPSESYIYCKLNEQGRLEMANSFTRYKKGDLKAYVDPVMSKELKNQCKFSRNQRVW
ncbi:MAG: hypothetical protein N4A31_02000 [Rickettsiales bacterium]|jgi:hypothetical protein|nr:hypothetical protein [Rickettsiales bacterium]